MKKNIILLLLILCSIGISSANTLDETIYQEQTTQIPLNMFYVMFGILLFLILMSFRGIRDGVYIDNIIFCACSMLFMFYLSKLSINGSVTQIDTVISGAGEISSVYTPIINPSLNSFLELLGILFLFLLIGMIYSYIQDRKVLEE